MPDNKKPMIRYMIIDRCIRNTAKDYSLTDLMEAINEDLIYRGLEIVKSSTTTYKDITDMEVEFQAPIEKVQKGKAFERKCFDGSEIRSNTSCDGVSAEIMKSLGLKCC